MKIGAFITARLKSTRLPFKVLLDLNGATVIERVIQRAKAIRNVDCVVVCTSTNPQDRPIVEAARREGVYYFNGSEEDVLDRLHRAAAFHGLDGFVSVTADNPLFSIHHAQRLADIGHRDFPDVAEVVNLPLGMNSYFLKTRAVEVGCRVKETAETEFWPVLLRRPEMFDIKTLDAAMCPEESFRITLDTPQDYAVINRIYREVPFTGTLNEFDAFDYLNAHPEVAALNGDYKRSWLAAQKVAEIDAFFEANRDRIRTVKSEVYAREH